jgi:hypothetical protein
MNKFPGFLSEKRLATALALPPLATKESRDAALAKASELLSWSARELARADRRDIAQRVRNMVMEEIHPVERFSSSPDTARHAYSCK